MGWVLWSLACHPECQEKVIEEVDRIFENSDRDCTNEDLKEMKYLEKCIKEGLRLFPAVPLYARQVEEDFEVGKLFENKFWWYKIFKTKYVF